MAFSATARIPCRPLSYENSTTAEPKELIVDYVNHTLYLCDVDGNIVDITSNIDIDELWKQLESYVDDKISGVDIDGSSILKDIIITLTNGDTIIAETAIIESIETVREIKESIKDGTAIDTIPAEKVIESTERQFVSEEDKNKWNDAADTINDINNTLTEIGGMVDVFTIYCTIAGGEDAWTSTNDAEPYTQNINVEGILSSDNPIVDVLLSEDYNTAMDQLNSYAFIYKITTFNGSIKVFATEPTEISINLQMKIDRKNS